jgi:hypothetical protein
MEANKATLQARLRHDRAHDQTRDLVLVRRDGTVVQNGRHGRRMDATEVLLASLTAHYTSNHSHSLEGLVVFHTSAYVRMPTG